MTLWKGLKWQYGAARVKPVWRAGTSPKGFLIRLVDKSTEAFSSVYVCVCVCSKDDLKRWYCCLLTWSSFYPLCVALMCDRVYWSLIEISRLRQVLDDTTGREDLKNQSQHVFMFYKWCASSFLASRQQLQCCIIGQNPLFLNSSHFQILFL